VDVPLNPVAISPADLRRLITRPEPTILDIGCNDGEQTWTFLELFPEASVFCFEPDDRARARFHARWHDSPPAGPGVFLFPTAVGAVDGTTNFFPSQGLPHPLPKEEADRVAAKLPNGWDLSGSIRQPKLHLKDHPWCEFGEPTPVPITRLDTWSTQHCTGTIDFIWADVQGAEIDLIEGGLETLARTKYFYTEWSDRELYAGQVGLAKIWEMLPDFKIEMIYNEDVLLRNTRLA